jgi:hypothetical protein
MHSEYVVLKGKKLVVHADKCKCAKRIRDSFVAYGFSREEVSSYLIDCMGFEHNLEIDFAPCALKKLANYSHMALK